MATMFDGLENINAEEFAKLVNEKKLASSKDGTETEDFTGGYKYIINNLKYYIPLNLRDWFLFDTWDIGSGLALLCDIDPTSLSFDADGNIQQSYELTMLNGLKLSDRFLDDVLREFFFTLRVDCEICSEYWQTNLLERHSFLLRVWKSGNHTEDRYPPKYFIDWAISKGIKPKWLNFAKKKGLINDDNKPEIEDREPAGKSRTSFQNAMAALFNELLAAKQERNPKITKSAIIQKLMDKYSGVGITESFLTKNINEGQKTLQTKQ